MTTFSNRERRGAFSGRKRERLAAARRKKKVGGEARGCTDQCQGLPEARVAAKKGEEPSEKMPDEDR